LTSDPVTTISLTAPAEAAAGGGVDEDAAGDEASPFGSAVWAAATWPQAIALVPASNAMVSRDLIPFPLRYFIVVVVLNVRDGKAFLTKPPQEDV
jgi:hypothetical protein